MQGVCTKLMVIRHAEKPDKVGGTSGVTKTGIVDRAELTVKGWQRAGALVRFFNPPLGENLRPGIAVPGAIFAAPPTHEHPSKRPVHTVTPLAIELDLKIRKDFAVGREAALIVAAQDVASVVLICWHHGRIPKLLSELGVEIAAWADDVFDRVLVLDRAGDGWTLSVIQQHLLPGDS